MDRYRLSDADEEPRSSTGTTPQNQLVRSLGLLDILMVGIAAMIGGSIYVLTGPAIGLAGSAVIIALIINATITALPARPIAGPVRTKIEPPIIAATPTISISSSPRDLTSWL